MPSNADLPRVLFVDDDPSVLSGFQRLLRNAYGVNTALGGAAGLLKLQEEGPFAVVISDMNMPNMDGVQFLTRVRDEWPESVRVMLTGNSDQATAREAVNQGRIFRLLNKPCAIEDVRTVLDAAIAEYDLHQTEQTLLRDSVAAVGQLSEKLEFQLAHDGLTGLPGRNQLEDRLTELEARPDRVHALCHMDVDRFGVLNTVCGHVGGDGYIQQIANLLRHVVGEERLSVRLAGDQFAVLLEDASIAQVEQAADEILRAVRDLEYAWNDQELKCTASVGAVVFQAATSSAPGRSGETLIEAQAACAVAKSLGGNQVYLARAGDATLTRHRDETLWVPRVREAIRENRFCVFAQLIAPLVESGEGLHFETLIRLRDADGEFILPQEFLPAVERYKLGPDLDRWMIHNTLAFLTGPSQPIDRVEVCSINLSAQTLTDPEALKYIVDELLASGCPAGKICFEVTETSAIGNLAVAIQFIDSLRELGCKFALDDFGVGFSSFSYLKWLPVDFLKIDGSFVKSLPDDLVDLAMVRAINEIAHVMGKRTIAEYVEDETILRCLEAIGVDFAQGFGIGKPMPIEDFFASTAAQDDTLLSSGCMPDQ